jgi:hypothetical protein
MGRAGIGPSRAAKRLAVQHTCVVGRFSAAALTGFSKGSMPFGCFGPFFYSFASPNGSAKDDFFLVWYHGSVPLLFSFFLSLPFFPFLFFLSFFQFLLQLFTALTHTPIGHVTRYTRARRSAVARIRILEMIGPHVGSSHLGTVCPVPQRDARASPTQICRNCHRFE